MVLTKAGAVQALGWKSTPVPHFDAVLERVGRIRFCGIPVGRASSSDLQYAGA